MTDLTKETVIIVHGTWAAPTWAASKPEEPAKRRWYEPIDGRPGGEPFPAKLDAALQERGSPARCWAHCTQGDQVFHWSGDNSWIARTRAASELADYVTTLRNNGWRCHIVAHSHGGNIVVESLPLISKLKSDESLGELVTLGTPFIDVMSPILKRAERRNRVLGALLWLGLIPTAFWTAVSVSHMYDFVREHGLSLFASFYLSLLLHGSPTTLLGQFLPLLIFVLLLIGLSFLFRTRNKSRGSHWSALTEDRQVRARFLALGSSMDEAWQVLHHLRTIDNPLEIGSNLFVYLFSSVRSAALQSALIARIHGAKSYSDLSKVPRLAAASLHSLALVAVIYAGWAATDFKSLDYFSTAFSIWAVEMVLLFLVIIALTPVLGESFFSVCISPLRWCAQKVASLTSSFPALVTYGVRYFGWPVLIKIVAGLEGYRFEAPLINQYPSSIPEKLVKYENIPMSAERRALHNRTAWISAHLGDVSETFSKLAITAADITSLLRTIEHDQTLVHAAYYTDDECVVRIANWIAGRR